MMKRQLPSITRQFIKGGTRRNAKSHPLENCPVDHCSVTEDSSETPQLQATGAYTQYYAFAILLDLFDTLSQQLPSTAVNAPAVTPEMIRERVKPMVAGLVQEEWRETALRELGNRVFVLNAAGARKAIEAELTTSWLHDAWKERLEGHKRTDRRETRPGMEKATTPRRDLWCFLSTRYVR